MSCACIMHIFYIICILLESCCCIINIISRRGPLMHTITITFYSTGDSLLLFPCLTLQAAGKFLRLLVVPASRCACQSSSYALHQEESAAAKPSTTALQEKSLTLLATTWPASAKACARRTRGRPTLLKSLHRCAACAAGRTHPHWNCALA